ncbi:transcriptional regulator [Candidatus Chlamydia sanziniae]|uniref:Transcriptional regulator n=2 Tax=Candidatus Chlamydia sanziniae TaxID=1806891 RepID=A0A1A9HWS6_9CHLA|nr:transcriptional regulator [Candidatus Chlamydia sanziniae]
MNKTVLFITEDHDLSLQLKNLAETSGYKIKVSSVLIEPSEAGLAFGEYLLLSEATGIQSLPKDLEIIVLFDSFEEQAIVDILNRGASGYLLRPITANILDAVIRALFRQHESLEHTFPEILNFGDRVFRVLNLTIESPEGKIFLTPSEAGILKKLLMNRGHLCLRKNLLEEIKGNTKEIILRNVDVHIASLRKKLGPYGFKISTIRGVGYLFLNEDTPPPQ